ncbi:MAG: TonB-dependent receptor plug domain-containing protein [Bacteroidota bacterium]
MLHRSLPGLGKPLVIVLVSCSLTASALAEDESIYFSDLPVVASVSRLPQNLADAPTAVTVIDRELIKASGARDLNDIFRLVPGFQTYPNNTETARATYHGMGDGDYAPRVQVMIDGRSMYSPLFGGGVNWSTLPVALEDIERIEVVRGTNAVSYGSNAFLGVINIITIDPALVRGVSAYTAYGNQNVRDYGFRAGGKLGEVGDFRFTYKQLNDDGLTNRYDWVDSYFSRLFDFRADLLLSDRDSLQVSAGQADGMSQLGRLKIPAGRTTGPSDPTNPIRDLSQSDTYAQLLWRRVLSPTSDVQVRYSYALDRSSDYFSVPLPAPLSFSVNQSGDQGVRHELELQHSLKLLDASRLVWGASWRDDAIRSKWALPGQGTVHREVSRLFGNVEWKPAAWFTGNAGLAGEDDTMAGFHTTPRVSTNFHLDSENTVRFGYSRAYRTPSTVNFLGNEKVTLPSPYYEYVYAGVPNLPPERLDSWEIGYLGNWRAWRASLDVRLFSERIHDRLFVVDMGANNANVPSSTIPIQNVRIKGIEYQFKWQPFEATRVLLNQTFAHIDSAYLASALAYPNTTLSNPLKAGDVTNFTDYSMPRQSTSLLLMQKLPLGLELSLAGYWQDKMKWSTNTWSRKYERVDARLGYPFRTAALAGEVALTVQSLNGDHNEYKSGNTPEPADRVVERRQWISLRLDY